MTRSPFAIDRAAAASLVALLAGSAGAPAYSQAPRPAAPPAPALDAAAAALEARYAVGPAAAEDFGFRIAWQTGTLVTKGASGQALGVSADSVWFGDSAGSVVRVRRDDGQTVWRGSTNPGIERIQAVEYLPSGTRDNVYVVTDLNLVTMDAATGALTRKSHFAHLPSCVPTVYGPSMVFGTRTGLCCWYQYGPGFNWRSISLGGNVVAPVTVAGDMVLVASTSGAIHALDASTAAISWTRSLAAGVEAAIAADDDACYVASLDQSLWAFGLQSGRVLWQHFTESPLRRPPVRIADGLYVQIPGEGLTAFTPIPKDRPEGEVRWRCRAPGDVVARIGNELFAWDRPTRTLTAIDAGSGRIMREARFPRATELRFTDEVDGDLVVLAEDGCVERLEPVSRAAAQAAAPAPARTERVAKPADASVAPAP